LSLILTPRTAKAFGVESGLTPQHAAASTPCTNNAIGGNNNNNAIGGGGGGKLAAYGVSEAYMAAAAACPALGYLSPAPPYSALACQVAQNAARLLDEWNQPEVCLKRKTFQLTF
jgi:hypothetical protein